MSHLPSKGASSSPNDFHRDIWRNCLECPANTILDFKKHHESIQQRAAIDESRRDKQGGDKRKQAAIEKLQS